MQQQTQEWLELRKTKITATDAPIIMEMNDWETPYQRWRKKLDLDPPQEENEAMRKGTELEPIARKEVSEKLGIELNPVVRISRTVDWMMASLDAMSEDGKTLVEIKCPSKDPFGTHKEIPKHYIAQLQHQMVVCELDQMYYFVYFEGNSMLIKVYRDDKFINKMIEMEGEFYECMQTLTAPTLTSKDYFERTDEEWIKATSQWLEISQQRKELEKKEERAREWLIELAGNSNCRGSGVSVSKIVRKGNIAYKEVPQLQGIDLELYRGKPIESWRIS